MIGTIRVGNKRWYSDPNLKPDVEDVIVNIDRPNLLSNPYTINERRDRKQSIQLYREDLERDVQRRQGWRYEEICKIIDHLVSGRDVILMCWCAPLACHGEVIKEVVEKLLTKPVCPKRF